MKKKNLKTSPAKTTKEPLRSRLGTFFGRFFGTICGFFAGLFRAPRTEK